MCTVSFHAASSEKLEHDTAALELPPPPRAWLMPPAPLPAAPPPPVATAAAPAPPVIPDGVPPVPAFEVPPPSVWPSISPLQPGRQSAYTATASLRRSRNITPFLGVGRAAG